MRCVTRLPKAERLRVMALLTQDFREVTVSPELRAPRHAETGNERLDGAEDFGS
jgi:hypothetical protein